MKTMRRHYERVIVACAFFLLFVNVGFTSTAFSIYQSHIVDLPGVGDVGGSLVVTVRTLVALVCMFFTGFYFNHVKPRVGFFIATMCTVAAFVLFASAQNMAGLCLASALAGMGYGFGGMVASTYLIGNWFHGKVGSVSGIVTMGSGTAAIFMPMLAGWLIDSFSLSTAFFVEGMVALAIAVLIFAFVRTTPYDIGLDPVEPKEKPSRERDARPVRHPKEKLSSVRLPKGSYAAMLVALVLLGGVSVSGYNYFGILLTTQGIDPVVAAGLISIAGVFLTLSKFVVGIVCDRFGTFLGSLVFFVLLIGALVLCSMVGAAGVPEAAAAAVVLGIGMPLGTTGISLWSLELSSPDDMLKTIKRFQVAYAFGGFAFNMMPGVLCQMTGTYTTTYEVLTVMAAVCAAMVLTVYAHHILRARRAYEEHHR